MFKVLIEFSHINGYARLIIEDYKYKVQFSPNLEVWDTVYHTWCAVRTKSSHIKYFHKVCSALKKGVKINKI